jgi:hypothetical protein
VRGFTVLWLFIFGLCGFSLLAQSAPDAIDSAPPPVEQALRAHVTQYFQAYIDGKWRNAERLVAEDSLDAFLGADKDRVQSFEIVKTHYHENFSKAEVVVVTRRQWVLHGNRMVVPMATTTFWKVVDGQWLWYAPPRSTTINSPFGTMAPGPKDATSTAGALPADPAMMATNILNQVKVDKTEVQLSSYEPSSAEVTIASAMPGKIELRADTDIGIPGFLLKLDRTELKGGEKCKLLLSMDPNDQTAKPTVTVRIRVLPLNKIIPIKVTFAIPPSVREKLPPQAR